MSARRQLGSVKTGDLDAITKAYKRDPSIENYLALRRANPEAEIEVAVTGGIDQLFYMETELRRFGIDIDLVLGALDANPDKVGELSLQLMEKMIEAKRLSKKGQTHLVRRGVVLPDKLIDWLISVSLDALSWNDDLYIPRDLIVLIRERLGGADPEYEQASKVHQRKRHAAIFAGRLKAQGIRPTFKVIGDALGVAPSTVKRWFGPGEFDRETDVWAGLCDKNGKLVLPGKLTRVATK